MEAITPPPNRGFSSKKYNSSYFRMNWSVSGPIKLYVDNMIFVCSIISLSSITVATVDSPDETEVLILGIAPINLLFFETYASTVYSTPSIYF